MKRGSTRATLLLGGGFTRRPIAPIRHCEPPLAGKQSVCYNASSAYDELSKRIDNVVCNVCTLYTNYQLRIVNTMQLIHFQINSSSNLPGMEV